MALNNSKNYFSSAAIVFFIFSAALLLFTDKTIWPDSFDLPYMGYAALACALTIFLSPVRYKNPLALVLLFNASGDIGLYELYKYGFEYDKIIHFISPMIATLAFSRTFGIRKAIVIVGALVIGWELFEYFSDALIKTHLFGIYGYQILRDTILDLVMNTLGIVMAVLIRNQHSRFLFKRVSDIIYPL